MVIYLLFFLSFSTVPDSPLTTKSARNDTLGVRQRIRVILKTLVENHKKWDAAQRRGVSLCNSIENTKSHAIKTTAMPAVPGDTEPSLYPIELKTLAEKLRVITTIFEDVLDSGREAKKQLTAVICLGVHNIFSEQSIVFKTWTCDRIAKCLDDIIECYEQEYDVKVKCMQNIAHSKTAEELVLHSCVWEFPTFVTCDFVQLMKSIVLEADIEVDAK